MKITTGILFVQEWWSREPVGDFFRICVQSQNVSGIADGKFSGRHKSGNGKSGSCVLVADSFRVNLLLSMFLVSIGMVSK